MPQTATNIAPSKIIAPQFRLKDTNSNYYYSFRDLKGLKGTLIIFLSNDCPFVNHALEEILMIAHDYRVQGIGIIAISSNDINQEPHDGPAFMTEFAFKNNLSFPYLYDDRQEVARALSATFAPDFYLFDSNDELFYHGQLDDSRPANNISLSGTDLRCAIDAVIYNRSIPNLQKPSVGCKIKWQQY